MKRKIYNEIKAWKERWNGKTALLIDGARRVGKSWIAEEFAKNEYKSYILVDFNNIKPEILEVFERNLHDVDVFLAQLSVFYNTRLYPRESVIIFDEIQLYPKARAALKYLVAEGRYDYIETGSLVSINHNVKDIVIPSEEVRINMYPMDFEEFMWAVDQKVRFDFIRESFEDKRPLGQTLNRLMIEQFKEYMMVGGMPQAVLEFAETRDYLRTDDVKKGILDLYRNDISKYAGRQAPNVSLLFDSIPSLLSQHEKRLRASLVKKGAKLRAFADSIFWLNESRVVNLCHAAFEPSLGLRLNSDDKKLKLYMGDTGLLVSMIFSEDIADENIYKKIIKGKLEYNEGMLCENIVAQQLAASGHPLYFYSSSSRESAADRMEIDFLIRKTKISSRHNICPIEVKSGNRFGLSSLNKFENKFKTYLAQSIVLYPGDLKEENGILYLPLYMSGLL